MSKRTNPPPPQPEPPAVTEGPGAVEVSSSAVTAEQLPPPPAEPVEISSAPRRPGRPAGSRTRSHHRQPQAPVIVSQLNPEETAMLAGGISFTFAAIDWFMAKRFGKHWKKDEETNAKIGETGAKALAPYVAGWVAKASGFGAFLGVLGIAYGPAAMYEWKRMQAESLGEPSPVPPGATPVPTAIEIVP